MHPNGLSAPSPGPLQKLKHFLFYFCVLLYRDPRSAGCLDCILAHFRDSFQFCQGQASRPCGGLRTIFPAFVHSFSMIFWNYWGWGSRDPNTSKNDKNNHKKIDFLGPDHRELMLRDPVDGILQMQQMQSRHLSSDNIHIHCQFYRNPYIKVPQRRQTIDVFLQFFIIFRVWKTVIR